MKSMLHFGKHIISGLILGMALALLLGHWTWLAMRFSTPLLIPVGTGLGLLVALVKKSRSGLYWLVIPQLSLALSFVGLYHEQLEAIQILPAILFKQGLALEFMSISQTNLLMVVLSIFGNMLWLIDRKDVVHKKSVRRKSFA